jgi:hypothetical protein
MLNGRVGGVLLASAKWRLNSFHFRFGTAWPHATAAARLSNGLRECDRFASLRNGIAIYLRTAQGVRGEAEQIMVANGPQQALDTVLKHFLIREVDRGWKHPDNGLPDALCLERLSLRLRTS